MDGSKWAVMIAQSVYYNFRDYHIMLTSAHISCLNRNFRDLRIFRIVSFVIFYVFYHLIAHYHIL